MTKMKKIISIILIVILSASLSVGITLAYLTDRDSDVNVFTLGNVDIELKEDFQQGSALKPNLDINKDVQI
jgi:predicted ribosomally synthesized peptide with SipW-like signal peptide